MKLLCGKVSGAELKKMKQSSPKQPLKRGTGASFVSLPLCHAVARHGLEFGGRTRAVEVEPKQMVRRVFSLMDHKD